MNYDINTLGVFQTSINVHLKDNRAKLDECKIQSFCSNFLVKMSFRHPFPSVRGNESRFKKKLYVSQITNDATNRNQHHHCFNPNNSNNNNNNNNNSNFCKYYVSRITNDDATSRVQQHHYTLQYISSTTTTTTTTTKKIYRQIQPHQTNKKIRKM